MVDSLIIGVGSAIAVIVGVFVAILTRNRKIKKIRSEMPLTVSNNNYKEVHEYAKEIGGTSTGNLSGINRTREEERRSLIFGERTSSIAEREPSTSGRTPTAPPEVLYREREQLQDGFNRVSTKSGESHKGRVKLHKPTDIRPE